MSDVCGNWELNDQHFSFVVSRLQTEVTCQLPVQLLQDYLWFGKLNMTLSTPHYLYHNTTTSNTIVFYSKSHSCPCSTDDAQLAC